MSGSGNVTREIQVGEVVYLKSGGPKLTVERIESGAVDCIWFNEKTFYNTGEFMSKMLTYQSTPKSDF